jgi:phosphoglycolate phosphatase-like HAD superfamily hydrolase
MTDPLPSWNDGETKRQIIALVRAMADDKSDTFVPPESRIAVFDNDGTLWCEKPAYIQASFLLERWREMVQQNPRLGESQPYKAAADGDMAYFADLYAHIEEILRGVGEAFQAITPEEFDEAARQWFASTRHPRFGVPYTELIYQPMRELLDLVRNNGFKVFIATGGGRDFVRVVSEALYAVPRECVIGSAAKLEYRDGKVLRLPELVQPIDDGPGKPIHIYERIGRPPVFVAGNSDGDIQMLEMARFGLLLYHDDAEREYSYDAGAEKALEAARRNGWLIVSMRSDFAQVFAPKRGARNG